MHKHEIERIVEEAWRIFECELDIVREILGRHHYKDPRCQPRQVRQALLTIYHNQKFIIMDALVLKPGKRAPIVPALIDAVTGEPVPGATYVPKSNTVDNGAAAVVDADGKLAYVAAGIGKLTSVNTWTYVDQNTKEPVTADQTTVIDFKTLAAAEVVQQTISLGDQEDIPVVQTEA